MTAEEVIIFDNISPENYKKIAINAARYAIISVGFTYDRMGLIETLPRIKNIIKGKIAEGLFYTYCDQRNLKVSTSECTTPFWQSDLRDFLWLGGEWDLKNNFFYCKDSNFSSFEFLNLPALIPNKFPNDQWSKRNENHIEATGFTAFLFTFMRLQPDDKDFFSLNLTNDQLDFLVKVRERNKLAPYTEMPFMESWFWENMSNKGPDNILNLSYQPELIITSCANVKYWPLFKNTSQNDPLTIYSSFLNGSSWYKSSNDLLKFAGGALVTKIRNMTCPVCLLPSFKSIADKYATE
ncbi:MAG: hypothetical protein WBP08_02130 [Saprospiraceae bacterium]|jgi:hypothetical protein|nr:hypothetical protein [Saprospiraceae bacterium]